VAFEVIRATTADDAYANLLLPAEIDRAGLNAADAALATELTYGTLRRRGTYEQIVRLASGRELDEIDQGVLDALCMGTHQLLATRVAAHAAVNESVELARRESGRGAAGFANAVLRRISRDGLATWEDRITQSARSADEALGFRTSHPVWILRAFRRALAATGSADQLEDLLEADNASPSVTMVALPGLADVRGTATRYSPVGFRAPQGDPRAGRGLAARGARAGAPAAGRRGGEVARSMRGPGR
jgi:16S rRNA (cytosine967-C5)-methyltransferase